MSTHGDVESMGLSNGDGDDDDEDDNDDDNDNNNSFKSAFCITSCIYNNKRKIYWWPEIKINTLQ